jgi:hypothetical protein
MGNWLKKTPEQREAILKKLQQQKDAKEQKIERRNPLSPTAYADLIKKEEIPLYCMKCGWTSSERYSLNERRGPFGKEWTVEGNCRDCKRRILREIPICMESMMMFPFIFFHLIQTKRLEDKRSKT